MFNNVERNKKLEKMITAQLTHYQHSAILSYMSKPNDNLDPRAFP